ncbi:vWA domain-containing protein [Microbaculum sp. FT89]|uniref:vWA domain-containing protein n=1 Tax=Microbaculum sp. FT89 TaxID=3447298 RepID=UPI003F536F25
MTDDLDKLKHVTVPEPSADARSAALQAGLAAFDASSADEKSREHQGAGDRRRLKGGAWSNPWRWLMDHTRISAPVAASLLILPAAALLAYQVFENYPFTPSQPSTIVSGDRDAGGRVSERKSESTVGQPSPPPVPDRTDRLADVGVPAPEPGQLRAVTANEAAHPALAGKPAPVGGSVQAEKRTPGILPHAPADQVIAAPDTARDSFTAFESNPVKSVKAEPVSTFSVDVDTAAYSFVRRMLNEGRMPPRDAVRVEEMINYFPYDYPLPADAQTPFSTNVAVYPSPWNANTKLLHIGLKAYDVVPTARPATNLVFLIDVSGSMNAPDKLPLLKTAFRMLLDQLGANDTVSIVTYAGEAGTVLEPTRASEKTKILDAIDTLQPGGSTAGAAGIEAAYRLAEVARREGSVNRVLLATDGDFNVGLSDPEALKTFIAQKRKSGIFLSVLGFGQGNYQDSLMQALAQNGNGVAAYIDTLNEARKVLVEEAGAALFTVAKDVKVQIEFNPSTVSEYRLIGYETRALATQDFNNDRIDAGDIGSGHTVTAIYEITPTGSPAQLVDDLRYGPAGETGPDAATTASPDTSGDTSGEYAFLKLRYKLPDEDTSTRITVPVTTAMEHDSIDALSDDYRFAASVAAFGQTLRHDRFVDDYGYDAIADLAAGARGADPFGYRSEFVGLVRLAKTLDRN